MVQGLMCARQFSSLIAVVSSTVHQYFGISHLQYTQVVSRRVHFGVAHAERIVCRGQPLPTTPFQQPRSENNWCLKKLKNRTQTHNKDSSHRMVILWKLSKQFFDVDPKSPDAWVAITTNMTTAADINSCRQKQRQVESHPFSKDNTFATSQSKMPARLRSQTSSKAVNHRISFEFCTPTAGPAGHVAMHSHEHFFSQYFAVARNSRLWTGARESESQDNYYAKPQSN